MIVDFDYFCIMAAKIQHKKRHTQTICRYSLFFVVLCHFLCSLFPKINLFPQNAFDG